MNGTDKKTMNLSDIQSEYLGYPDPYRNPPACKYDHRALVENAKKVGKSINDLSFEEKAHFIVAP